MLQKPLDDISMEIHISKEMVGIFNALFYEVLSYQGVLSNPEKTLRGCLKKSSNPFGDYYIFQNFIFEIKDNVLESVSKFSKLPKLSQHSKDRISMRLHVSNSEILLKVAVAIVSGKVLSRREKDRLNIDGRTKAIQFEGYIYLFRDNVLVTVY